jgi:hypothetical protein
MGQGRGEEERLGMLGAPLVSPRVARGNINFDPQSDMDHSLSCMPPSLGWVVFTFWGSETWGPEPCF